MQKTSLLLLLGIALLGGATALLLPNFAGEEEAPIRRWSLHEEEDVQPAADAEQVDNAAPGMAERIAIEAGSQNADRDEARVEVLLRGRVIDKWNAPVAGATVWMDFARGGQRGGPANRQRRVPEPVTTDKEGRFAFQGQAFRNLRVSLQVAHQRHAPGLFDRDLGEVGNDSGSSAEVELGDLALMQGGSVLGRVTDLEGNGIAGAKLRVNPENNNRMRMLRNRDNLLPELLTDQNGYFRGQHLPTGDWSVAATARRHTEGRSGTFATEEEQSVEIDDIRLGPGYEVTGIVRNSQGQPIAKAEVTMRGQQPPRGGRGQGEAGGGNARGGGNFWQGGRDHSTTTDEQGRFFLEHLPGVPMRLDSRAEGYLDYRQEGIDVTAGQQLQVAMQDGLRITGTAVDDLDGQPVSLFAVRAVRLRGLPVAGAQGVDWNSLMTQMRDPNLDDATRQQLRTQMEAARAQFVDVGGRGNWGGGPGGGGRGERQDDWRGGGNREFGRPTRHADGNFVLTGLQEGVYEVQLQATEHARFRSQEIEVRASAPAPAVVARLDRGVYVAGLVLDERGEPVRGARVELRTAVAGAPGGRRGRDGNNNQGFDFAAMGREFARQAAQAQLALEAVTDQSGEFIVKHVPRGSFRLQASAKGYAAANGEPFELEADRSDLELRLDLLGSLEGRVRGLNSKETSEARVAAVRLDGGGFRGGRGMGAMFGGGGGGGGGPFQNVSVSADGSYRFDELAPGEYLVRSWLGSPQELMRELGPRFFSGELQADVVVRGGETARRDVEVVRPLAGEVAGTVLHNGRPAAGYQIELTRVQDATGDAGGRGRGGMMGGMMGGGRNFQAAVNASGSFRIADVPVGSYRLRVQAGRRGGMLHEEQIQVAASSRVDLNLNLATTSLAGTVSINDGDPATLAGMVSLLPGLSELPPEWNAWRRDQDQRSYDARLQGGKFRFEAVPPGNYLLVLTVRGRERSTQPVSIAASGEQSVNIAAGAPAAAPAGGDAATPRPGRQGGGGRPGGGGPGGGGTAPAAGGRNR